MTLSSLLVADVPLKGRDFHAVLFFPPSSRFSKTPPNQMKLAGSPFFSFFPHPGGSNQGGRFFFPFPSFCLFPSPFRCGGGAGRIAGYLFPFFFPPPPVSSFLHRNVMFNRATPPPTPVAPARKGTPRAAAPHSPPSLVFLFFFAQLAGIQDGAL